MRIRINFGFYINWECKQCYENANIDVENTNIDVENANIDVENTNIDVENANIDVENANMNFGGDLTPCYPPKFKLVMKIHKRWCWKCEHWRWKCEERCWKCEHWCWKCEHWCWKYEHEFWRRFDAIFKATYTVFIYNSFLIWVWWHQ